MSNSYGSIKQIMLAFTQYQWW